VIPPGQEGKVVLEIDSRKVHGSFRKVATVKSNDPEHPSLVLSLTGTVTPYVEAKPSDRVYLRGVYGESVSQTVTLISNEKGPFEIKSVSSNIDDKITYKLLPGDEPNSYKLKIWKNPNLPTMNTWGTITLETNSQHSPQKLIQVNVNTRGSIIVSPSLVNFGVVRVSGASPQKGDLMRKLVVFKSNGEFQIKDITFSSSRYRAEVETLMPGRRYEVKVYLSPGSSARSLNDEMTIHTDDPHESTVKVRLLARLI